MEQYSGIPYEWPKGTKESEKEEENHEEEKEKDDDLE